MEKFEIIKNLLSNGSLLNREDYLGQIKKRAEANHYMVFAGSKSLSPESCQTRPY